MYWNNKYSDRYSWECAPTKTFSVGSKKQTCYSTGSTIYIGGDPGDPNNYWDEYIDNNGETHYAY